MMPYGSPELEEIIFEPSNFPSRFVEPEAVYFNQTINPSMPTLKLPPSMSTLGKADNQGV
ncbi:MAG: hypothetical protein E7079_07790 [Bacteroidales bacterium]|nr:hypothetical protein [Bacteroidales bacterium]